MKITLLYQVSHYIRVKNTNKYKELGPAKLPCYKRSLLYISDLFITRFHCIMYTRARTKRLGKGSEKKHEKRVLISLKKGPDLQRGGGGVVRKKKGDLILVAFAPTAPPPHLFGWAWHCTFSLPHSPLCTMWNVVYNVHLVEKMVLSIHLIFFFAKD